MQQQITELTNLLKGHFTQSQTSVKRVRSEEEIDEHQPKHRLTSVGQEVKQSSSHIPQNEDVMDDATSEESGNPSSGGSVGERARSRSPLDSSKTPSETLGRNVKGGGKTGSSQSTDGKGAVSKKTKEKPKPITAPNKPFR